MKLPTYLTILHLLSPSSLRAASAPLPVVAGKPESLRPLRSLLGISYPHPVIAYSNERESYRCACIYLGSTFDAVPAPEDISCVLRQVSSGPDGQFHLNRFSPPINHELDSSCIIYDIARSHYFANDPMLLTSHPYDLLHYLVRGIRLRVPSRVLPLHVLAFLTSAPNKQAHVSYVWKPCPGGACPKQEAAGTVHEAGVAFAIFAGKTVAPISPCPMACHAGIGEKAVCLF